MINLAYELRDHGWAQIDAQLNDVHLELRVSYMSRALRDIAAAAIDVLSGKPIARFALIEEPGSLCSILKRTQSGLDVTVVYLDSMYYLDAYNRLLDRPPPEEAGERIASAACGCHEFGDAVAVMFSEIERRYSPDDFARTWNPPAPTETILRLRQLLTDSAGQP
jgi:hypothetical protein